MAIAIQTPGPDGTLGLPILLMGDPGVGKTARINIIAESPGYDFKIETILAALRGPEDFLGMPLRTGTDAAPSTVYAPPKWARDFVALNPQDLNWYTRKPRRSFPAVAPAPIAPPRIVPGMPPSAARAMGAAPPAPPMDPNKIQRGLLFLDELTTAEGRVMTALLRVLHERVVGDLALPGTTAMIAAANPPDQAPAGQQLPAPIANRMIHIRWPSPQPTGWSEWLVGSANKLAGGVGVENDPVLMRALLAVRMDDYQGFVNTFLSVTKDVQAFFATVGKAEHLFNLPDDDEARAGAWPSPRSWEVGIRGFAAGMARGHNDAAKLLLRGSIGEAAAAGFLSYLSERGRPDPKDLLDAVLRGGSIPWSPTRVDVAGDDAYVQNVIATSLRLGGQYEDAAWRWMHMLYNASYPNDRLRAAAMNMVAVTGKIHPSMTGVVTAWQQQFAKVRGR